MTACRQLSRILLVTRKIFRRRHSYKSRRSSLNVEVSLRRTTEARRTDERVVNTLCFSHKQLFMPVNTHFLISLSLLLLLLLLLSFLRCKYEHSYSESTPVELCRYWLVVDQVTKIFQWDMHHQNRLTQQTSSLEKLLNGILPKRASKPDAFAGGSVQDGATTGFFSTWKSGAGTQRNKQETLASLVADDQLAQPVRSPFLRCMLGCDCSSFYILR